MTTTRYLTRGDVLALSALIDVEGALARILIQNQQGFAGQSVRTQLVPENLRAVLGIMPAYRAAEPPAFAAKVVCVVPANPSRGLPAHQGLVMLFDAGDGAIRAIADAGAITEVRTAALTALATRTLGAVEGPHLVVGAGHQGEAHLRAMSGQPRPLQIWSRRRESAENLAERLSADGIVVEAVLDLEQAVRAAAVLTTVTAAAEPIVRDEWLRPGALFNAIGSSTPRVREVPKETLKRARLVVDDIDAVSQLSGEMSVLTAPLPAMTPIGAILARAVEWDTTDPRSVVFKSVGVPLQDLALLDAVADAAAARSTGQVLQL